MNTDSLFTDPEFRNLLRQKLSQGDIAAEVAREALAHSDIPAFFSDLAQYGCVCGMVGSLIYYADTHAFFDWHYAEIEELREEWEDSTGLPISIRHDLKNTLAWFAFERIADEIAQELGLE